MFKLSNYFKPIVSLALTFNLLSCNADLNKTDQVEEVLEANNVKATASKEKYLCVSLNTGGNSELLKIMNLKTRQLVTLPINGFVQDISANLEEDLIYVSAKSPGSNDFYSLFRVNVKTRRIERILSFSQFGGLIPSDFLVRDDIVYAAGKRAKQGGFYSNDLKNNRWTTLASNINVGRIEPGFNQNDFHVISFDDEYLARTIVDSKRKLIKSRKSIFHGIPFGNNVFIPSPHGSFIYVLHQLKNKFTPFAFNMKQGSQSKADTEETDGLLYSVIVSNDGKHLLANVNSSIYHYNLRGSSLEKLPNIDLDISESRHMVMGNDNRTLYVTHDIGNSLSIIKFASNYKSYRVEKMFIGNGGNKIYLF